MSKKINHWCVVCGKGYHACDSCDEMQSFTPWRKMTDTPEHYKIFLLVKQYNNNLISKAEAKTMLANINISDIDTLKDDVKKVLNEILAEDVAVKKSKKKAVKSEDVETDIITEESDTTEE